MKYFNNSPVTKHNDGYLFDPFFDDFFGFGAPKGYKSAPELMKTDVEETDDEYRVSIELAGFKKDEITLDLDKGYLTVSADHSDEDKEEDKKKKFVRRERSFASCRRTFYLGDNVTEDDVSASFEDGVLKVCIKKTSEKIPEVKKILIK